MVPVVKADRDDQEGGLVDVVDAGSAVQADLVRQVDAHGFAAAGLGRAGGDTGGPQHRRAGRSGRG